jgi:hypothetical protein
LFLQNIEYPRKIIAKNAQKKKVVKANGAFGSKNIISFKVSSMFY